MIILAFLLLGLAAPFLFIYGWLGYLLLLPFGALFNVAKPYWLRLSPARRRSIRHTALWTLSISLWISILVTSHP